MKLENGISVVLLAYKEADNLRVLLPDIISQMKGIGEPYEILVVDTMKPLDDTEDVCKQYNAVYQNQEEAAFGGAFKTGIKYARKEKFLIMDSDGSHQPKYIPNLYEKFVSDGCDVVIGSRYVKGGKTNDSALSHAISLILNTVFRICIGIRAHDLSTDFRLYDTYQLKRVKLKCMNYDVLQEVLLKLQLKNRKLKIGEVPITFEKRLYGETKRQLVKFMISYLKTLFYLMDIRIRYGLKRFRTGRRKR
ncbi:MAG: glycosyltransferase [Lachnospiraceae bacterium]|nr:glycosyltransferase [Lachnospiraceae bacterium]